MVNPGQQVQTLTMLRCGEVVVTRGVCGGGATGGWIRNCCGGYGMVLNCLQSNYRVQQKLFINLFPTSPQIKGYRPHFSVSCVESNVYAFKISEVIFIRTKIFQSENKIFKSTSDQTRNRILDANWHWYWHSRNEFPYIFILLMQMAFHVLR